MLCGMTSGPAQALANSRARRAAYWFPLALFGLIVAVSVPLHAAGQGTAPSPGGWVAYAPLTQSVSSSSAYNSSLSVLVYRGSGPFEVPEGWYWAAALTGAFLLTMLWYWTALHAAPAMLLRHGGSPEQTLAYVARPPQPSSAAILLLALGLLVAAAVSLGWPSRLRRHRRDG